MMSMFIETNCVGVVLEKDDKMKLKYLTTVMIALMTSGKSTFATWLRFFEEGMAAEVTMWLRPS